MQGSRERAGRRSCGAVRVDGLELSWSVHELQERASEPPDAGFTCRLPLLR